MNKVHATTQKIAAANNLYISLEDDLYMEEMQTICIENELDDSDARGLVTYIVNENGTYTFHSKCEYSEVELEDLPATINNEKHLREVVKFIGSEVAAQF